jgi:hypothetical protein
MQVSDSQADEIDMAEPCAALQRPRVSGKGVPHMPCLQCIDRRVRPLRILRSRAIADQAATFRIKACQSNPRLELIDRVRRQIATGTYNVDSKFELVLDRLLDLIAARA